MFSIYGISGPIFHGPLEELARVRAVPGIGGVRGVRAITSDEEELAIRGAPPLLPGSPGEQAVNAYRAVLREDLERGPLYHAYQIMRGEVIVLAAADKVDLAWRTLIEHRIRQAPVLDGARRLVGIVSERDLLTTLNVEEGKIRDVMARQVGDVMTSPVVSADPVTDIRRIARVMLEYGVDGVPIVNEAQALVGFVSRSDVLAAVVTDPPLSLWR